MNSERVPGSERRKESVEKKASAEKAVREVRRLGLRAERGEPPERRHPAVAGAVEREADDEGRC